MKSSNGSIGRRPNLSTQARGRASAPAAPRLPPHQLAVPRARNTAAPRRRERHARAAVGVAAVGSGLRRCMKQHHGILLPGAACGSCALRYALTGAPVSAYRSAQDPHAAPGSRIPWCCFMHRRRPDPTAATPTAARACRSRRRGAAVFRARGTAS